MNPDGSNKEVYVSGVRNTVGFTWHPETGEMWFTDNGRDMLGDNYPPCELNKVQKANQHFGYPYCHGNDISDPEFGSKFACDEFIKPVQNLGPHVAPLGLKFYQGNMFPDEYNGTVDIYTLDREDNRVAGWKLHDAFPRLMNILPMGQSAEGIVRVNVTFAFRRWTSRGVEASDSERLFGILNFRKNGVKNAIKSKIAHNINDWID